MIRAFLFDIGNVLLPFDFAPALARLRARSRATDEAAWERLASHRLGYESGGMDRAKFLAAVREEIGFVGDDAELTEIWGDIFTSNPPMDALVARLAAAGWPLWLLSNTCDLHVEAFMAKHRVFRHFRGAVYSHEERMMKPDAEIFRRAIRRFGLVPAETVYVDDLAPNVAAAAELGFAALEYDQARHGEFEARLRALVAAASESTSGTGDLF